jgi:hypothetical protein
VTLTLALVLATTLLVLALLLVLAARGSVTLSCNVQGKADPSGAWAVACGLGCGPLALSAIAARGVKPFLTCHVFGKQLARLPLSRWVRPRRKRAKSAESAESAEPEATPDAESEPEPKLSGFERGVAGLFRALDPVDTVIAWLEKERVFQLRALIIEVDYSFRDVALTGRILAGLYMLSAVLPDVCELHQTPGWESEDRVALGLDGTFTLWPGRLVLDIARFVLKQRSKARRSAALAKQAAESS